MPALNLATLDALNAAALPLPISSVAVPEFGDGMTAYVAALSADERDERVEIPFLEYKGDQETNVGFRAFLVAACLCSEAREFLAKGPKDIKSLAMNLGKQAGGAVTRLFNEACTLNGIGETEQKALEKNSPPCAAGNGTPPTAQGAVVRVNGNSDSLAESTRKPSYSRA